MASIQKRESSKGVTSFRLEVRLKGCPPQRATFARLTDAKKWAASTEFAIRENRYFKTAEARRHTFDDLVKRYISEVLSKKPELVAIQASVNSGEIRCSCWEQASSVESSTPAKPILNTL